MAKGRFISRSIASNEQLAAVSFAADYLFDRCIPHLDVDGRMSGNPALIKSSAVPLRAEITEQMIPELLAELAAAVDHTGRPLVQWYEQSGTKVLEFPGFAEQQSLNRKREAKSKYPARGETAKLLAGAGWNPATGGTGSGKTPAKVRSSSGGVPDNVPPKLKSKTKTKSKNKREERDASGDASPPRRKGAASEYPPEFERAWELYPKRPNNPKVGAFKAWSARRKAGAEPTAMLEGVVRYAAYCASERINGTNKVMQAQTFFGPDERWTDAFEVTAAASSDSPALARARDLLAIARDFDLLSYNGNQDEYNTKARRAKEDPRAGDGFGRELKVWKPWEGLAGLMTDRAIVSEIARRLGTGASA
jgi:hypothetical protein